MAQEACSALAVVLLVDRFLYWTDESSRLLKITKLLHRRHPDTPVAPQLVIRQARVYLNSGTVRKSCFMTMLSFMGSHWLRKCEWMSNTSYIILIIVLQDNSDWCQLITCSLHLKRFYYIVIIAHFHYRAIWRFCHSKQGSINLNTITVFPTGKLQKAEYILSSLINNSGATGTFLAVILIAFNEHVFHKLNKKATHCFPLQVVGCITLKVTGLLCRPSVSKCVEWFCKS